MRHMSDIRETTVDLLYLLERRQLIHHIYSSEDKGKHYLYMAKLNDDVLMLQLQHSLDHYISENFHLKP